MAARDLARLQGELDGSPFGGLLRLHAVAVGPGRVVVRLPFRPEFGSERDGESFHGGIVAAAVDITAQAAMAMRTGRPAPTMDLQICHVIPAHPPFVVAVAQVQRVGCTVGRVEVEVSDSAGDLVAWGSGALNTLLRGPAVESL